MPAPNIDLLSGPMPAFRGLRTQAVGSDDVVFERPVAIRALDAGNLVVVDALGTQHAFNGLSAGDSLTGPGGALVLVKTIRGASTVASVQVGIF